MKDMNLWLRQYKKIPLSGVLFSFFSTFASFHLLAKEQDQTVILLGSTPAVCSSVKRANCKPESKLEGKEYNTYTITAKQISKIAQYWPTNNAKLKDATIATLNKIKLPDSKIISKADLLWRWRDSNNQQLQRLSQQEYNYVVDMLEVPTNTKSNVRQKEQISSDFNNQSSTNEIMQFIAGTLKVNSSQPTMLTITAGSRDPYAAADFSTALLEQSKINTQWLALTPALVKAITTNRCDKLVTLRHSQMGMYNREAVYPDHIKAEAALCNRGIDALITLINNSTGVMFAGGSAKLLHNVLFDENNKPFSWTHALKSRPVIIGIDSGSAIQGGFVNMPDNLTSLNILNGEHVSHIKGLNTFDFGTINTQFSENNRTLGLASTLLRDSNKNHNMQQQGVGIDENTALVLIKSAKGNLMTVVGENGVVHLTASTKPNKKERQVSYSYWPAGSIITINNTALSLSTRTINSALPNIKIPALPAQRFKNILTDAKFRSLAQAMCLSHAKEADAQQSEFLIGLTANASTAYHRVNAKEYGCAISNLNIAIRSI